MFDMDQEARSFGVTAVENRFILDYLPAAKGDYIKVYLWALYACREKGEDYSLDEMAQDLMLTRPEVEAALRYWERRALLARVRENPPLFRFYSPTQRAQSPAAMEVDTEYVAFAETVYAIFADIRKVTPSEISQAWEWVQDIGLKPEAVIMLLQHCISQRGAHFSFKIAERLAVSMKEAGADTPDAAEAFLQHDQAVHDGVKKVLSRMGKRRLASDDETALYEKWIGEWGFDQQAVLDACREMTSGDPSFKYLDGILNGLRLRGDARTGEQVKKQLDLEKEQKEKAQEVFTRLGSRLSGPAAARVYQSLLEIQPHEVLLLAADECCRNEKNKGNIENMQALLESWRSRGLVTRESVKEYLSRYREANLALKEMFDACGYDGKPTEKDRQLYEKWKTYHYDRELMLFAAEQARAATGNRISYLSKVLEAWHEAGITDISQAKAQRSPQQKKGGKTVSAQQYGQRQYTEEELLAVSDDLIEEARRQRG